MSAAEDRDVFRRCFDASKQCEAEGDPETGTAILAALEAYLDTHPAFPDKSCWSITHGARGRMRVRAQQGGSRGV